MKEEFLGVSDEELNQRLNEINEIPENEITQEEIEEGERIANYLCNKVYEDTEKKKLEEARKKEKMATKKIPVFVWNRRIAVVNKKEDEIICPHCGSKMNTEEVSRYYNLETHKTETFVNSSPQDRDELVFKDHWDEWSCLKCGFGQHTPQGWKLLKELTNLPEKERRSVLNRLSIIEKAKKREETAVVFSQSDEK